MSNLRNENVTKCFTLLREFVENAGTRNDKKEFAILALEHLQRITAGSENNESTDVPMGIECLTVPISWPYIH